MLSNNVNNGYYESLWEIYSLPETSGILKYRQMRELLENICRGWIIDEGLQMTDLSAQINYLSARFNFTGVERNYLHTLRINSVRILNGQVDFDEEMFLYDLKTLSYAVQKIYMQEIPQELFSVLPKGNLTLKLTFHAKHIRRLRVCFLYADDQYLYVNPSDMISEVPLKVSYNAEGINNMFSRTVDQLWEYAQLNLLDVSIHDGVYIPAFIVLEPDYLIDISSLAECYKEYGSHPANYNLNRLSPVENARPLLLGNIVNMFLDEWIHASGNLDYVACMQKAFRNYPIELAACEDLKNREKELEFFGDCKMHFENIRQTVRETFGAPGYGFDPENAVLEPSYICEALGVQGRLDYMQRDMSSFIEMKSGKADEYAMRGKVEPKENNKIQMLLYLAVLEFSMGMDHRKVHPYLFYTRYPLLYPSSPSWTMVKEAINLRNLIVASEYKVQLNNTPGFSAEVLREIIPRTMNERRLRGKFWEQYLLPSIAKFETNFDMLSDLEKSYFLHLYSFIVKEMYLSKSGGTDWEKQAGAASLWLSTLTQKQEAGEIFYDLKIISNRANDKNKPSVTFSVPAYGDSFLPNFRIGDAVLFYERNGDEDNATNKMVFKGNIEQLTQEKIKIRMRSTQRNVSVLPPDSYYAVEPDYMDTTFKSMFLGLHAFMTAAKKRRDLLLAQQMPRFDKDIYEKAVRTTDDFERVALKALAADDYFLLVGPPGTGKTSRALKAMVEKFYEIPDCQILLLAYTNRAVDEICKSLCSISPGIGFIRLGNELSCDKQYREYLLENRLSACVRRSEVSDCISGCRIFVGTVASVSNKPDIFKLKTFDVVVVDEATQILEPHLLQILCLGNNQGKSAVGKFILIGDHKQLPAVVLQKEEQSAVRDEMLNKAGLVNLKDSLFERLYRFHKRNGTSEAIDMLCKQGRMNPAIAAFPNRAFYGGKLQSVGLPHQTDNLEYPKGWGKDIWEQILQKRIAFIPSVAEKQAVFCKVNHSEARIVACLAAKVSGYYGAAFDENKTLGIITPYRNQVALIKKELASLDIPSLNEITVDTVERFQGSERDVILYSFCVNRLSQLKFLSNLVTDHGTIIDRKLNVVLTRARKQLYLTGVPDLLKSNPIYSDLLKLTE